MEDQQNQSCSVLYSTQLKFIEQARGSNKSGRLGGQSLSNKLLWLYKYFLMIDIVAVGNNYDDDEEQTKNAQRDSHM